MRETSDDLARLQDLIDRSYAVAGSHLRTVITPDRVVDAAVLSERLVGVRLMALATSTADGRPMAAPIDGIFYRGEFWFGSAPDSLRFRHIRSRPAVSAVHIDGEPFSITVHGTAEIMDLASHAGFRECCVEIYGESWNDWGSGALYARITADRLFTFSLDVEES